MILSRMIFWLCSSLNLGGSINFPLSSKGFHTSRNCVRFIFYSCFLDWLLLLQSSKGLKSCLIASTNAMYFLWGCLWIVCTTETHALQSSFPKLVCSDTELKLHNSFKIISPAFARGSIKNNGSTVVLKVSQLQHVLIKRRRKSTGSE